MLNTIVSLEISFIITLLAAFIGSYSAFNKYKKEKLWQEKYNAYQEILGSIYNMKHWASETYASCLCLPTIGNTSNKEFH